MNTMINQLPGDENNQQNTSEQEGGNSHAESDVQVSLPRIDRPEGPFPHSGEVAGWTAEEEREKKEQADQQGGHE